MAGAAAITTTDGKEEMEGRKRLREGGREKERASQKRKVALQSNLVVFTSSIGDDLLG